MALILTNHNAHRDHVSALGWDPMSYLIEGVRQKEFAISKKARNPQAGAADETISLSLDVQDIMGERALRLRAQYGGNLEFDCYYDLNVPNNPATKMSWKNLGNPMHFAIASGNLSTLLELLPYYLDDLDE